MNNFVSARVLGMPSWVDFWLAVVLAVVNGIIIVFMATKMLQILQLSGYKFKGVNDWQKQTKFNYWGRLIMVSVLSCAAILITNVLLDELLIHRSLKFTSVIFYFVFACVYIINTFSVPQKSPIKYTQRMSRLVIVVGVLSFLISVGFMYLSVNLIPYFTAGGIAIIPIFTPLIVYIAHLCTNVVEKAIAKRYIKKAKAKLASHTDLKIVGVTGSFGKTSVKNIIAGLLAEKYKVCVTPFSYNTPLGLSKTVLENLDENDQVFVAEMGARNVGDIAELCNMVQPTIGVITGIGNQHMATFGSSQNLINTKAELVTHITNRNGTMVFNTDTQLAEQMYNVATCTKVQVGLNVKSNIYATDINSTKNGSVFTLHIGKEKYKNVTTTLLGEHNISNILTAVCVAVELGLSGEQIVAGISKLVPTAHRLALVPSTNALVVIDDAYNGSLEGTKSALNVLAKFDGTKVVITPGLVELGAEQFNSNFEFGRNLAKVADYVIITGVVNYDAISSGLEFCNFATNKIIRAGTLNQAVSMLSSITNPGDVVLFENDLPDNYV